MKKDTNKQIIIGFSIGDYNGIGPEILLKSFSNSKLVHKFIPVVFCDKHILEFYSKRYGHEFKIKEINNLDSITDENSIYTFAERADALGYLGRDGYTLAGLFYHENISLPANEENPNG